MKFRNEPVPARCRTRGRGPNRISEQFTVRTPVLRATWRPRGEGRRGPGPGAHGRRGRLVDRVHRAAARGRGRYAAAASSTCRGWSFSSSSGWPGSAGEAGVPAQGGVAARRRRRRALLCWLGMGTGTVGLAVIGAEASVGGPSQWQIVMRFVHRELSPAEAEWVDAEVSRRSRTRLAGVRRRGRQLTEAAATPRQVATEEVLTG